MDELKKVDQMPENSKVITPTTEEIEIIENDISFFDRGKLQKNKLKKFLEAQDMYWRHKLHVYEQALAIRDEVEIKQLASKSSELVMKLEIEHTKLMQEFGVTAKDDIMKLAIDFAEVATKRFDDVEKAKIKDFMKAKMTKDFMRLWEKTHDQIVNGLDAFVDQLVEKDAEKNKH